MLQPVTIEQGGSSTRDNEVELMLLVLVRNMDCNDTKDRDFHTCIRGEFLRRGKEWGSSVRGPEPVVRLFAHNRQGCTCVHFHGGFGIDESYRDFDRLGSLSRGVVESVLRIHGLVRMCRFELVILGLSTNASCRSLVTGILAADRCKVTDLLAVVTSGGLELAGGG